MALPNLTPRGRKPLQDHSIFGIQRRARSERTKRPWIVRWAVEGRQHSRSFGTRIEADRYRSHLVQTSLRGERFDVRTGEPESWLPDPADLQCHQWVRRWLAEQWDEWQPRTRRSALDALTRFVPLLVTADAPPPPPRLRAYLAATLPPGAGPIDAEAEAWLEASQVRLSELTRELLAEVDRRLGLGDWGQPLAPSTAGRFRKVAKACLRRAVVLQILAVDPWPPAVQGRAQRRAVRVRRSVDVRALPDPKTMARALDAMVSHQPSSRMYRVMTAVAYYAGLRPSEVIMLRPSALTLPAKGWGRIEVREADISFDESGEPKMGPRSVPIPPVLVSMLREWLNEREVAPNELLFRTRKGTRPTNSNWLRTWHRALESIDHEPLRIYDCRHAAATTWLRAGVPLGEVARRLGHSVETLVSTYVGAIEGDEAIANTRIEAALA